MCNARTETSCTLQYTYSVLVLIATFFVEHRLTDDESKPRSGRVDSTFSELRVLEGDI